MWRYSALLGSGSGGGGSPTDQFLGRTYGTFGLLQDVAHTVSSATTLGAPNEAPKDLGTLNANVNGLVITVEALASGRPICFDVMVAGTRKIRFFSFVDNGIPRQFEFEIAASNGQQITFQGVSNVGSAQYKISAGGWTLANAAQLSSVGPVAALGANHTNTGVQVDLDNNNWIELVASSSGELDGIGLYVQNANLGSARTVGRFFLDIGVGANGAETVVVPAIPFAQTAAAVSGVQLQPHRVNIPAGSRIAVRKTPSIGDTLTAANDVINVQANGRFA